MQDDSFKPARDEAFRKLGRNIVLFQHLELLLKQLVSGSRIEGGSEEEVKAFIQRRNALTAKSTLGVAIGYFFDDVLGRKVSDDEEEKDAFFMRARFRVEGMDHMRQREAVLVGLVEERNQLVHHLLQNFDLWSSESIQRLDDSLDPQAERIRNEIGVLRQLLLERREMTSRIRARFESMSDELLSEYFGLEQREAAVDSSPSREDAERG